MNNLSLRLQTAVELFDKCNTLADVGCDHGYLSIELLDKDICSRAICCDINAGPLDNAKQHAAEAGVTDRCEFRLSNGLEKLQPNEADAIAILGMGGILMKNILTAGIEVAQEAKQLVLSPQSEIPEFRCFLVENGFSIDDEAVVYDMGKYYFLEKCHYTGKKTQLNAAESYVGPVNLAKNTSAIEEKRSTLYNYLMFRKGVLEEIFDKTKGTDRGEEIFGELTLIRAIMGA